MTASIKAALQAFADGEIVVVTDDDDREGEGDLVVAASLCTTEKMAFIIRNTSGIVCAPMTVEDARRLRLDPMVLNNDSAHTTAFTVSVDYRPDNGTGISAEERASCCRALANPNAGADDFCRPGHVFPLIAKEGGVLMRSGHTEAAIDLCKLADLEPVGVISELMNDDGSVMKGPQVAAFADKHKLKQVTIADLIRFRQARETLIERVASVTAESPIGPLQGYSYRSPFDPIHHVAYIYGDLGDGTNVLTRFYKPNILRDLFSGQEQARMSVILQRFKDNGSGVLVYLRDGAAGVPPAPLGPVTSREDDRNREWREIGVGAQILRDLKISSIRHLTSSTHHFKGLSGFGIEIVRNEAL
ncbi:3,4-dihydroxy-2-butanone 4-phosphate synthase [Rhodopseudomonas sp. AAP120]|uniref:3,4-dihydroxy-2-butanone-4-phosphate synthase n=1 Tax=Rhodopseudomonas sp. AAP120 TaxID=1523430 RepID=UPI0006B97E82|nr:3,4-dihydroxy-2-butanone-4-phosphate synthase [Rhodopseudomonas sp. AAP120]KPF94882.1 3,4-dihydroxy-2-butanone 4-phosphate synthase [Rhodopseudomonas sp. AAP120]